MREFLILLGGLLCGGLLSAQDIITQLDGTDIQAKVLEVGQSQISYKKFSNLNGPTYSISVSEIIMITYENGEREMYNNQNAIKASVLPQGIMSHNSWSGKVSVNGIQLEDGMLSKYFTPEDYKTFKNGRSTCIIGGIIACIGAFPLGYSLGWMIGGGEPNMVMLSGGSIAFLCGLIIDLVGESYKKIAINNYNSQLAFQPEIHFGVTPNSIGLTLAF